MISLATMALKIYYRIMRTANVSYKLFSAIFLLKININKTSGIVKYEKTNSMAGENIL